MIDEEKLKKAVIRAFNLSPDKYQTDLKLGDIKEWDSLGQMTLIFTIEETFNHKFESDAIPKLTSLDLIRKTLVQK